MDYVVGNIPYDATEEQLIQICEEVGPVVSFRLVCFPYYSLILLRNSFIFYLFYLVKTDVWFSEEGYRTGCSVANFLLTSALTCLVYVIVVVKYYCKYLTTQKMIVFSN